MGFCSDRSYCRGFRGFGGLGFDDPSSLGCGFVVASSLNPCDFSVVSMTSTVLPWDSVLVKSVDGAFPMKNLVGSCCEKADR